MAASSYSFVPGRFTRATALLPKRLAVIPAACFRDDVPLVDATGEPKPKPLLLPFVAVAFMCPLPKAEESPKGLEGEGMGLPGCSNEEGPACGDVSDSAEKEKVDEESWSALSASLMIGG